LRIVKRLFSKRLELLLFGGRKMRLKSVVRGALASVALSCALPASAAVVIDQDAIIASPPALGRVVATVGDRTPPQGNPNPPLVNAIVGQSITAGVTGTLDSIELQGPFWNTGQFGFANAFRFSLFSGDIGAGATFIESIDVPVAAVLTQAALNSASTFYVDISPLAYAVNAGDVFSFSVELLGRGAFGLITIGNVAGTQASPIFQYNQYAGGRGYFSNNGSAFGVLPGDVGFRTYVNEATVTAVPEPGTWLLMVAGFGLAGLGLRLRRRDTAAA
jgi:PEP-CTERM motif